MENNGERKGAGRDVTYPKLFWLFMIGSLIGVVIEGVWYYFRHDHWETHVVSVWGSFCIIYGIGAAVFYAANCAMRGRNIFDRFAMFAVVGTAVELACGLALKYILNMKAWDYTDYPMDFMGLICVKMVVIWGIVGLLFGLLMKPIERVFRRMDGVMWSIACVVLTVFMAANLTLTGICLLRWADRHRGKEPSNSFTEWVDKKYDDEYMSERFCEWRFLD